MAILQIDTTAVQDILIFAIGNIPPKRSKIRGASKTQSRLARCVHKKPVGPSGPTGECHFHDSQIKLLV